MLIMGIMLAMGLFLTCSHSMVEHLTTYLTTLKPWMTDVTEALNKLSDAPVSATELESNVD